jgi:hypothetical protein
MFNSDVRSPAVAGLFYPDDPDSIHQQLQGFLHEVSPVLEKDLPIRGVVAPHAGFPYSGLVAAYAYKAIAELKPSSVIIIGPSHRLHFDGAAIFNGEAFATPLGQVAIDNDYASRLQEYPGVLLQKNGHENEHSIEVQLPFLQHIYSHDYRIVPVALGSQDSNTIQQLATALKDTWEEQNLIIASSDLSHFYDYDKAMLMDSAFSSLLESGDIDGLWNAINEHRIEACGFGGVLTLLHVLNSWKEQHIEILKLANSADASGDRDRVVGYLSAVVQGR